MRAAIGAAHNDKKDRVMSPRQTPKRDLHAEITQALISAIEKDPGQPTMPNQPFSPGQRPAPGVYTASAAPSWKGARTSMNP